mgnify:FL=1
MILHANCKINLGLDVLRRREDGYHELSTVMFPVRGLYDVVGVTRTAVPGVRFLSEGLAVDCAPGENICVKAFQLMRERYGVDGVMIGRATYGRPWIFREVKHYLATGEVLPQPSICERVEIAKEHLRKSLEIKGEYVGILEMRRHLSNYFKGLPDFKPTRLKLVTLLDIPELFATLDSIAERWGDFDVSGTVPAPLSHDL